MVYITVNSVNDSAVERKVDPLKSSLFSLINDDVLYLCVDVWFGPLFNFFPLVEDKEGKSSNNFELTLTDSHTHTFMRGKEQKDKFTKKSETGSSSTNKFMTLSTFIMCIKTDIFSLFFYAQTDFVPPP